MDALAVDIGTELSDSHHLLAEAEAVVTSADMHTARSIPRSRGSVHTLSDGDAPGPAVTPERARQLAGGSALELMLDGAAADGAEAALLAAESDKLQREIAEEEGFSSGSGDEDTDTPGHHGQDHYDREERGRSSFSQVR
jgi:hypothetical protein